MVDVVRLHLDTTQNVVPCLASACLYFVERVRAKLLQVLKSLLLRDERRRNAHVHLLATAGLEAHDAAGMVAFGLNVSRIDMSVGNGGGIGEVLVKLHHKIVLEVMRYATRILCSISHNHALLRHDLDIRTLVESVNYYIALVLGEGDAHDGSALCRCKLGHHIVVGKIGTIIIRCSHLGLVREPRSTLLLIEYWGFARLGHDSELSVVVNPWTGLMSLLESAQLVGSIGVGPSVAHLSRLRSPEVHAPWHTNGRIGVACRNSVRRLCSDKRAHIVYRFVMAAHCGDAQRQRNKHRK